MHEKFSRETFNSNPGMSDLFFFNNEENQDNSGEPQLDDRQALEFTKIKTVTAMNQTR